MKEFKKGKSQKELTALSDELNEQVARNVSSRVEGINYLEGRSYLIRKG